VDTVTVVEGVLGVLLFSAFESLFANLAANSWLPPADISWSPAGRFGAGAGGSGVGVGVGVAVFRRWKMGSCFPWLFHQQEK